MLCICHFILIPPPNGIIDKIEDCTPVCVDGNAFDKIKIMSNAPLDRFKEWIQQGTFVDSQYNIFNRSFVLENEIFADGYDHRYWALWWIMSARIFVKTPIICYIRRNAPDSGTNSNFSPERIEKFISNTFEMIHGMDKHFAQIDFFKDNEYFQYMAKAYLTFFLNRWEITRRNIYANGITPEIYQSVAKVFKEKFGENYFYPMFLFNWAHVIPHNHKVYNINFENNNA